MEISLHTLETALDKGLVKHFLEAIMNREPAGFLSNFGIQYIIRKPLSLFSSGSLRRLLYSKLFLIIYS